MRKKKDKKSGTNVTPIKKGGVKPKLRTVQKRIVEQKSDMLRALRLTMGIVSFACKKVNISRTTHYRWLREDKDYAEEVFSIQEDAIDFAEISLFAQIRDKNTTATIFFLKTRGKSRGYGDTRYYVPIPTATENDFLKDKTDEELLGIFLKDRTDEEILRIVKNVRDTNLFIKPK